MLGLGRGRAEGLLQPRLGGNRDGEHWNQAPAADSGGEKQGVDFQ